MSSNNSDGKTPDLSASKLDGKELTKEEQGWTEDGKELTEDGKELTKEEQGWTKEEQGWTEDGLGWTKEEQGWTEEEQGWTEDGEEVVKVSKTIHVGSRESKLALIQTSFVIQQLEQVYGNHDSEKNQKNNDNQKNHDSQKNQKNHDSEKNQKNHDSEKNQKSQKSLFEKASKSSIPKKISHPGSQETSSTSTPAPSSDTFEPSSDTFEPSSGTSTPTPISDTFEQSSGTSTPAPISDTFEQSSGTSTPAPISDTFEPSSGTSKQSDEESDFMEHVSLTLKCMKRRYEFKYVLESMKTIGDKILDRPLPQIGDKGLFTKELEEGLASKSIDLIVHSLKDLPTSLPPGCCIGAVLKREDPQDALVLRDGLFLSDPFDIVRGTNLRLEDSDGNQRHPVVGTSSLRRQSQVKRWNPDVIVTDVRGNITTRLDKLDGRKGNIHFDALLLAVSGLTRAGDGHKERISLPLGPEHNWYYAVGQGALAIECRQDDDFIHAMLEPLNDYDTIYEILIERSLMSHLEGGCSVPIGVRSTWSADRRSITVEGSVFSSDGRSVVEDTVTCFLVVDLDDLEPCHRIHGGKKRKLSVESTFTGIITPKCPVLLHNFKSCFEAGAELSRLLKAKGAGAILEQIREEKKRKMEANGNGSANSSFESI